MHTALDAAEAAVTPEDRLPLLLLAALATIGCGILAACVPSRTAATLLAGMALLNAGLYVWHGWWLVWGWL